MDRLSNWIVVHQRALILATILLVLAGVYCLFQLPVAIFPTLTVPRIIVTTDAGDTPTNLVLAQITRPLESSLAGVPGVTRIFTTTQRGSDELDVTFAWGTDMQPTLQKVQTAINDAKPNFPPGANATAEVLNPSVFPVVGYSIYSDTITPEQLRQLAMYTLRPRLMRVKGVRQIMVQGGDTPDYLIELRPTSLVQRGVTIDQVQQALAQTNSIASVGSFSHSYLEYQVLVSGLLKNADDVRNVTVAVKSRIPITIGDIGTVTRSTERRTVETSGDGHDAVLINVVKQPEGNTVDVAQGIRDTLAQLKPTLPKGIIFSPFYDQSEIVRESQSSVIEAISVGAVLALVVLLLFLKDLRAASVVLLLLPVTLLITFAAMRLLGMSMNIMTLGAVAIALGLVIDDGIVVVESIYHEIELGHTPSDAVANGLYKTGPAMVGSSLTTIVAFLPLTLLSGVTGQFFGPLAIVMTAMLLISLLLSVLLAPLVAQRVLRRHGVPKKPDDDSKPARSKLFFAASLKRRVWILVALIPVAIVAFVVFGKLQTGFFPRSTRADLSSTTWRLLVLPSPRPMSLAEKLARSSHRTTRSRAGHDEQACSLVLILRR